MSYPTEMWVPQVRGFWDLGSHQVLHPLLHKRLFGLQ